MATTLMAEHVRQRFSLTLPHNALTQSAAGQFSARDLDWLVQEGQRLGRWEVNGSGVRSTQWQGGLSQTEQPLYEQLLNRLQVAGTQGMSFTDLAGLYPRQEKLVAGLLQWGKAQGSLVEVHGVGYVHRQVFDEMAAQLRNLFSELGPFTVAQARDKLQAGRKWTVALLETLDALGATRRQGDVRRWMAPPKL
jgi:selenocysteine-specific elongation factor